MGNKNYHFDTKRIHAGYSAEEHLNAVNTPIYQTAAFDLGDIDRATIMIATNIINKSLDIELDDNLIPYSKKG